MQQPLLGAGAALAWIVLVYVFYIGWIPFSAQGSLSASIVAATTLVMLAIQSFRRIWEEARKLFK